MIEFADFECPYCVSFSRVLREFRERYPSRVSLTFIHYPLPGHRYAEAAARAAECAGEQGQFELMHDGLFALRDQIGKKPWSEFATEAKVPNIGAFESCMQASNSAQRVNDGRELGEQLNIPGTPTLLVNGWQLTRPPSAEELDAMMRRILEGKEPV